MTNNDTLSERTPGLQFVWWETKKGKEAQVWWGQLAGSTHRLRIIVDQLEPLASKRNIHVALTELAYHLENYFVRIYLKSARDLCRSFDLMKKQCVVGSTQLPNRCLLRQRILHRIHALISRR
jgi:hypothetical protein